MDTIRTAHIEVLWNYNYCLCMCLYVYINGSSALFFTTRCWHVSVFFQDNTFYCEDKGAVCCCCGVWKGSLIAHSLYVVSRKYNCDSQILPYLQKAASRNTSLWPPATLASSRSFTTPQRRRCKFLFCPKVDLFKASMLTGQTLENKQRDIQNQTLIPPRYFACIIFGVTDSSSSGQVVVRGPRQVHGH